MHVRASKKNHGAQANFQNAHFLFFHLFTEGRFFKVSATPGQVPYHFFQETWARHLWLAFSSQDGAEQASLV